MKIFFFELEVILQMTHFGQSQAMPGTKHKMLKYFLFSSSQLKTCKILVSCLLPLLSFILITQSISCLRLPVVKIKDKIFGTLPVVTSTKSTNLCDLALKKTFYRPLISSFALFDYLYKNNWHQIYEARK